MSKRVVKRVIPPIKYPLELRYFALIPLCETTPKMYADPVKQAVANKANTKYSLLLR